MNIQPNFKKAAVIGGGLLGLEAARGLLNLGMEVDVIHLGDYLMERQLDENASQLLQKNLKARDELFIKKTNGRKFWERIGLKDYVLVMAMRLRQI